MNTDEVPDGMDQDGPDGISLLAMAQSIGEKERTMRIDERTKIGSNRAAFTIGGGRPLLLSKLTASQNLQGGTIDVALKKQTNKVLRKPNKFETPLEKTASKKASRKMYYDQTIKTVDRWDDTVKKFRVDPNLDLRDVNQRIQLVPTEARTRKLGTELERELDAILHGSKYIPEEGQELSRAEKAILNSVSIEEAHLRRVELQKHRHLECKYFYI